MNNLSTNQSQSITLSEIDPVESDVSTTTTALTSPSTTYNIISDLTSHPNEQEPQNRNDPISSDSEAINTDSDSLHDPKADDEDEQWVLTQLLQSTSLSTEIINPVSCPQCFTTLSFQSQPHDTFEGQFRAIAVVNVRVDPTCRIKVKNNMETNQQNDLNYESVVCDSCGVYVGAKDKENVYHFFNVIYGQST